MTGETHADGLTRYAVTKKAAAQFRIGEPVDTGTDLAGDPISGRVIEIKEGSAIALVIVQTD